MNTHLFQTLLIDWFQKNRRDLPWRSHRSPYRTWISEMMLQQTRVQTMLPYFDRWMKRLPDIRSLHEASVDEVLALWQGLGYYSRARNIKKAAAHLMEYHRGHIPDTFDSIIKVPGIGPYSAGAILSLAFNKKAPIADGNVLRVLSRIFLVKEAVDLEPAKKRIWALEKNLLSDQDPAGFNEALMELGALVCTPRNPQCAVCPVQSQCKAKKMKLQNEIPRKSRKIKIRKVQALAVILENNKRFLIERRPEGKIMGGLWEFPEWKLNSKREKPRDVLHQHLRIDPEKTVFIKIIKRHYTRFAEDLHVFKSSTKNTPPSLKKKGWPTKWVTSEELKNYPLTSAHSKIRELINSVR